LGINDINVIEDNTGDVTVLRALELASSVRAACVQAASGDGFTAHSNL